MPVLEETFIRRKSPIRVDHILNQMENLMDSFPEFGYPSVLGKIAGNWPASTVFNQFYNNRGIELEKSTRQNSQSLDRLLSSYLLDPEVSDEDLLKLRSLVLAVQASVTEDIYVDGVEDTQDDSEDSSQAESEEVYSY